MNTAVERYYYAEDIDGTKDTMLENPILSDLDGAGIGVIRGKGLYKYLEGKISRWN